MKKTTLLLLLLATAFPACQSNMHRQVIEDQDAQLEAYQAENQNLKSQLSRVRAENASLAEQLSFAQQRAAELNQRVQAMEAEASASDAELDNLDAALQGTGIEVGRRGGYVVLGLPSALTFPSGKADLNEQGKESLRRVADILKTDYAGKTFWIEGHTDNEQPKKSGWKNNLELSVARAMAVAEYMTEELGVDPSAIRVAGYGEFVPKASNDTPEGRAENRRVEILVLD